MDESLAIAAPTLLSQRNYVLFWCARVSATIAFQMMVVAVGWQIYELTGSAFDLGLVGLMQFIPVVAFALVVRPVAARYPRRPGRRPLPAAARRPHLPARRGHRCRRAGHRQRRGLADDDRHLRDRPGHRHGARLRVPLHACAGTRAGSVSANQTAVICGPAIGGLLYLAGPTAVYATCSVLFVLASLLITLIR